MTNLVAFMFQNGSDNSGANAAAAIGGMTVVLITLVITLILIAAMWKIFVKAGKPGWAAIIPIYNVIVLLEIAGRPLWWFVLLIIPGVNLIVYFIMLMDIARKFGKGIGYVLGMIFLPPIFYPMLAWGDATYNPAA